MLKKNKLRYRNFNICQLVDKGKLKLQYLDEFKEFKKIYHKTKDHKNKIIEKQEYNLRPDNVVDLECIKTIDLECINNLMCINTIEKLTYDAIKEQCNFVVIKFKETNNIECYLTFISELVPFEKENDKYECLELEKVESYLLQFNMVKNEYTFNELAHLLGRYKEVKNLENTKQLIKGKKV